ncbi:DUF3343 domain-containing protein [Fenollaria sporofastidiosus]|uniref:DUF3343 domain-containing protein n=1 Tax=Fenollaria sporofastidiosus TaxID=2811778 RepID=UPI001C001BDA|nr:DUF3343 domain-containing protein [Fenollaria sporofastidiosus]
MNLQQQSNVVIVTFYSISSCLMLKNKLKELGVESLIIPTPRDLSSSCGNSLATSIKNKELLNKVISEFDYEVDRVEDYLLYESEKLKEIL